MMSSHVLVIVLCVILLAFVLYALLLRLLTKPPVPCRMVIGKPGAGKSTLMVRSIYRSKKAGRRVVCTDQHIADRMGVEYVPAQSLLSSGIRDCDLYIDEAGLEYDNRSYKTFSRDLLEFFKLHRHLGVSITLYSQQYDIDKKIRDVCDGFSLVRPILGFFILERYVDIVIRIIGADKSTDGVARIVDDLERRSILRRGLHIYFAPRWWRCFDSYDTSRVDKK